MHVYMKVLAQLVFFLICYIWIAIHVCWVAAAISSVMSLVETSFRGLYIMQPVQTYILHAQFRVFNSYWYLNYISSLLVLIWWYTGFMKRIEFFSLLLWCWFIWSSRYMTKWAIKGWLLKLHIGNSYFSFTCFLPNIRASDAYIGYIFIDISA